METNERTDQPYPIIPINTEDILEDSFLQIIEKVKPYIILPEGSDMDKFIHYFYNLLKICNFNPSSEQLFALLLARSQPTLIDACAGSGKTTLAQMVTMIDEFIYGIPAERIYCVTYSRKATVDMYRRHMDLKKNLNVVTEANINTIHALCRRFIKKYYREVGLREFIDYDTNGTILSEEQAFSMFHSIYKAVYKKGNVDHARNMLGVYNYGIAQALTDDELFNSPQYSELNNIEWGVYKTIVQGYEDMKTSSGKLDFGDLEVKFLNLLRQYPDVKAEIQNSYDRWIIDEYQDTSAIQKQILKEIVRDPRLLLAIGDGDQTIYTWRGSDPYSCVNFGDVFPGAKILTLGVNRRCPENILNHAEKLINHNKIRNKKTMSAIKKGGEFISVETDSAFEGSQWVAEEIRRITQQPGYTSNDLQDIAVLFRNNYQPTALMDILLKYDIPMNVVSGILPYRDRIVTDFYNIVNIAINPNTEYYLHDLYKIFRSTKKSHALKIKEQVKSGKIISDCRQHGMNDRLFQRDLNNLRNIHRLAVNPKTPVRDLAKAILPIYCEVYYDSVSEFLGIDSRHSNHIMSYLLTQPEHVTFNLFLMQINENNAKLDKYKKLGGGVRISTLHSAKGLEFKKVFILNVSNSTLPDLSKTEFMTDEMYQHFMEEERRLAYVGITRAKETCYVIWDKFETSPFISEMGITDKPLTVQHTLEIDGETLEIEINPEEQLRTKQQGKNKGKENTLLNWVKNYNKANDESEVTLELPKEFLEGTDLIQNKYKDILDRI